MRTPASPTIPRNAKLHTKIPGRKTLALSLSACVTTGFSAGGDADGVGLRALDPAVPGVAGGVAASGESNENGEGRDARLRTGDDQADHTEPELFEPEKLSPNFGVGGDAGSAGVSKSSFGA